MFNWIKNLFTKSKIENIIDDNIVVLTLEDIKNHFESTGIGFEMDKGKIENIRKRLDPNRKNIFILDDICEIVDILEKDLIEKLREKNKLDRVNIISLCTKNVGFDMLSILSEYDDISIDFLITDIIFGGNQKINGVNTIIDGIDIVIISKEKNADMKYVIFTGNVLTEANVRNYNFAKKFKKYMNDSILNHTIIKDSFLSFNKEQDIFNVMIDKI